MDIKQIVPLVVTDRLEELKSLYGRHFGFEPSFEHESYLGLRDPVGIDIDIDIYEPIPPAKEYASLFSSRHRFFGPR